ncbi:MAG: YdeI/OmpD-associated family protein [Devosia sp.]
MGQHTRRSGGGPQRRPQAKALFEALAVSHRQRHVLSITDAKTDQARRRRLDKTMAMLRAAQK